PRTIDGLDRGLKWQVGSTERVINGGSALPDEPGLPRTTIHEHHDQKYGPARILMPEGDPADPETLRAIVAAAAGDASHEPSGSSARGHADLHDRWSTILQRLEDSDPAVQDAVLGSVETLLDRLQRRRN
ncbi:hypothetical protein, partial [Frankia sp. Cr1]|uniref:hypothetical protein n=1 Tax=Frankia sp. Cr1 TaxID=3073931 RepID=UPI002AD36C93